MFSHYPSSAYLTLNKVSFNSANNKLLLSNCAHPTRMRPALPPRYAAETPDADNYRYQRYGHTDSRKVVITPL